MSPRVLDHHAAAPVPRRSVRKGPAHWHFLALLPLPVLAGGFLASQPPGAAFVDPLPMVMAQYSPAPVGASAPPRSETPSR